MQIRVEPGEILGHWLAAFCIVLQTDADSGFL